MAWYHRIRNVFRGNGVQREIDRELSFHLAERVDELRASGMSGEEATRLARRQLGNYTAHMERTREMDLSGWLEAVVRNLRQAARSLAKTPVFTATVVLTLALSIGANSAVFSAIYAILLRPLPFPEADQLVEIQQSKPNNPLGPVAPVRLEDWNRLNSTLQALTGYYTQDESEVSAEMPEKLKRAFVAPRFLQVWGVGPAIGRDFTDVEFRFGGPNAILISDRLWRRRFAADPNVMGKNLRFGTTSHTIVGVMAASFAFPDRDVDLWSPSPPDAPYARPRENTWYRVIARMKPAVTVEQARANLATVQADLGRQFPKTDANLQVHMRPLKEAAVGSIRRSLWIVFGSVSVLLLIACTNVAALLLSRATQKQHEISVRFSLGASRLTVMAHLLSEVFLLALAGATLGLGVAAAASTVFRLLAKNLPRVEEIALNWNIVFYSLVCAVATTFLCGLLPALRGTRRSLANSMASASRTQVAGRNRVQLGLVAIQVAFAVTLLAGAGLLFRSLKELSRVTPGFDPTHVLTFQITISWGEFSLARPTAARILEGVRAVPGVEATAVASALPGIAGKFQPELEIAERRGEMEPKIVAESRFVSATYFDTLRIPLLAGELCRDDAKSRSAVVNRAFASTYFKGTAAAVGHHLQRPGSTPGRITGIVGDAREAGIEHAPIPTVYWCYTSAEPHSYFMARTSGDPAALIETIRRKVLEVEPRRSVFSFTVLDEHISESFATNRLRTFLLAFFAVTAVSLASVGLYGTLSYLVSTRQREVGLRLALGAVRSQIVSQFLGQGIAVSLLGCAGGLVLLAGCARLISGMLYGVAASDVRTLSGVVLVVLAVAILASLVPAIRASRLDPMRVLRNE